jgi:hypothetical protein
VLAALLRVAAIASGVGGIARNEKPHRARRELGRRHAVSLDRHEDAGAERDARAFDALGSHRLLERSVVDLRGRPVRRHTRRRRGWRSVELGRVPGLVRERNGDTMPTLLPARTLARRRRVSERLPDEESRDDPIGKGPDDGPIRQLVERRPNPLRDLPLRPLHVPKRRQRRERLGGQREQIFATHDLPSTVPVSVVLVVRSSQWLDLGFTRAPFRR